MSIDSVGIYGIIGSLFKGNVAAFGRELGVSYSTCWRVFNGKSGGEAKFIPAFFKFCKKNNIDPMDYMKI